MVKYDTSVELCGVALDNPVIPASGTFGFGREFVEFYDLDCLGALSFKGTTREARFGNPTPRIAECTAGMINAVGVVLFLSFKVVYGIINCRRNSAQQNRHQHR